MVINHRLGHGSSLAISLNKTAACDTDSLSVVFGGGRGCVLKVDGPVAGVFIPLRGRLQLGGNSADVVLHAGELRVTEPEASMHAIGRGNALWLAVLGGRAAWRRALSGLVDMPTADPLLLPMQHAANLLLRRRAIAVARAIAADPGDANEISVDAVIDSVFALQTAFSSAIERCPGRTHGQRRQVFLRLQRVRNYLASNCHLDVDNDALARMASYSPWHFIRAFRAAYCETPHAYLVDQRLQRARRLLYSSPLAIAEVALASGFENRCAFSRLFRQRFGVTAGAMRRQGRGVASIAV